MKTRTVCAVRLTASILAIIIVLAGLVVLPRYRSASAQSVAVADSKIIKVGVAPATGFSEKNSNGKWRGLIIDYLNEISNYTGWQYEYVEYSDSDIVDSLIAGNVDIIGGTYYHESVLDYFAYPQYNCGYTKAVILARRDDTSISGFDYNDLNGKTIGVNKVATENIRRLKEFLSMHNLTCTIKEYTLDDTADGTLYSRLESGEVDVVLGNASDKTDQYRMVGYFDSQPHYLVTRAENTALCAEISNALRHIYEADPNFAEEVYASNFSDFRDNAYSLTLAEKSYIQNNTVSVAVVKSFHPFYCVGTNTSHNGVVMGFLTAINEMSGLKYNLVIKDTYEQALEAVKSGEVDVMGSYMGTKDDAANDALAVTTSYVSIAASIVRNKSVSLPATDLTCGILKGTVPPQVEGVSRFIEYAGLSDAVADVNDGKLDIVYGSFTHFEGIISSNVYTNIVMSNVTESIDVGFAMTKPVKTELFSVLNKSINKMSDESRNAIRYANLVSDSYSYSFGQYLRAHPTAVVLISVGAAIVILLFMFVIVMLRMKKMRAEADSRAKTEFLNNISHEVRTPMNAIQGLAELMKMNGEDEHFNERLDKLQDSSKWLLTLMNDVLDMGKVESKTVIINNTSVDLEQTVLRAFSVGDGLAHARGIILNKDIQIENKQVMCDGIKLQQVLINLLSNAVKYTEPGKTAVLTVKQLRGNDIKGKYYFSVRDEGIGIAEKERKSIFKPFSRVSSDTAGTGLGLPLSKSYVELMGGELQFDTELGVGSEFYFTLDLMFMPGSTKEQNAHNDLTGKKLLLVEDNEINAEVESALLEKYGASVLWVNSGFAALDTIAADKSFDAILMDVKMSGMDGFETTEKIRADADPYCRKVPIIAVTANATTPTLTAARKSGINATVTKPIDIDTLVEMIAKIMSADSQIGD